MVAIAQNFRRFNVNVFQSIHTSADVNHDGNLSKTEFDAYKLSQEQIRFIQPDPAHAERLDALNVMNNNFNGIAYRALKNGEITTMDVRAADSTIEIGEILKLAAFDGDDNDVTINDVGQLSRGNTNNWPIAPNPQPTIDPPVKPQPTLPAQFKQLIQLLLLFLLFGAFRR